MEKKLRQFSPLTDEAWKKAKEDFKAEKCDFSNKGVEAQVNYNLEIEHIKLNPKLSFEEQQETLKEVLNQCIEEILYFGTYKINEGALYYFNPIKTDADMMNDKRWGKLTNAYKEKYNPASTLKKLDESPDIQECWDELWNELYHQGDIGTSAYASLIALVNIQEQRSFLKDDLRRRHPYFNENFYRLVGEIEIARLRKSNPEVPDWLKEDYKKAITKLYHIATSDLSDTPTSSMIQPILAVLAITKQQFELGAMLISSDENEVKNMRENHYYWKEYNLKKEI